MTLLAVEVDMYHTTPAHCQYTSGHFLEIKSLLYPRNAVFVHPPILQKQWFPPFIHLTLLVHFCVFGFKRKKKSLLIYDIIAYVTGWLWKLEPEVTLDEAR